ncbi:hypothetical protein CHS0354_006549 [Potamilus streckersoni]|uniref:Cystatin domain-containing protein n=1 Tax=Potamilus streckersoni TaxID=2493646 RepID=A0AAE0TDL5_9BIVA|nr:hypothetical protein CHS0354_006549 [Potamilus streckersoni]
MKTEHIMTLCDVKVLKQAWLHFIGLIGTPDCRVVKRHLGGYSIVDSTSPEVKAAAAFAVDAMNKQSNSINRIMLIKVVRAQQQVVAGMNYKLVLKVGVSSSCRNDGTIGMTVLNCPVDQRKQRCNVIVWDQPWRTPRYKLTSFKCQ